MKGAAMAIEPVVQHPPEEGSQAVVGEFGTRAGRPLVTRQTLRFIVAFFWLLDGALQLQSYMFTKGFASDIIAPAGSGQPFFVADPVHWNAQLISHDPALFNGLFAAVQLALGVGLIFRRTAKMAIVGSVLWAAGVWYLGEGLGGIAGGHMTVVLGAPGAAALYAVLALAAWPDSGTRAEGDRVQDVPSWTAYAWCGLWVGFAVLSVLPANVSPHDISDQLNAGASASPMWLASFDNALARGARSAGPGISVLWVVLELAIGLLAIRRGPLRKWAVWTGIGFAVVFWAAGQSFGQLFSGQATDPSTGPLLVVLGVVVLSVRESDLVAGAWIRQLASRRDHRQALAAHRGHLT
jgi:hypothetical protein